MRSKHKNIDMRRSPRLMTRSQHFSIFYCGCKQPNFSTFTEMAVTASRYSAAKIHKKIDIPNPVIFNALKALKSFIMSINYIIFAR